MICCIRQLRAEKCRFVALFAIYGPPVRMLFWVTDSQQEERGMRNFTKNGALLVMTLPGLLLLIAFHYLPIGGILIAFKDFGYSGREFLEELHEQPVGRTEKLRVFHQNARRLHHYPQHHSLQSRIHRIGDGRGRIPRHRLERLEVGGWPRCTKPSSCCPTSCPGSPSATCSSAS